MAESTSTSKLVLSFLDSDGAEVNFSYNYADPEVTGLKVNNAMQGIIENNSIFAKKPATIKEAKIVTTTTTEIDLEE